jgi:hypothetical protein
MPGRRAENIREKNDGAEPFEIHFMHYTLKIGFQHVKMLLNL